MAGWGLCTNLSYYCKYLGVDRRVLHELEDIFIFNGLSAIHPFNSGELNFYLEERIRGTLYNNPMRLSFIEFYSK